MSQVYPLDTVIRKVDGRTKADKFAQKIIEIDVNTGKLKKSFFATVNRYLVLNTKDENNYATRKGLICNVSDFEQDNLNFDLYIDYQVSCDPGKEVKVAEALWNNTHPGAELDRRLKKYIDNFFEFNNELIESNKNFNHVIKKLNQHIKEKVDLDIGLNIKLKIKLEQEDILTPLRISSPHFPVQFSEYSKELDLKFETELAVNNSKDVNTVFYSKQQHSLEDIIQQEIKKYLLDNISVEEFYGGLDTIVRKKLINHLNGKVLNQYGREMSYLSLISSATSSEVVELLKVDHQDRYQVREDSITIKSSVQLSMPMTSDNATNIGKYRMSGVSNLEKWVKDNLDIVIKTTLFDQPYVDTLLDFQPIRDKIEENMVERSKEIGYTVQQIFSTPENETLKLRDNFSLDVKQVFETKESNVKVELSIFVDLKIIDLKKIEPLLASRTDIKASMESVVENEVRSFLHTVEPERFYIRYFSTDDSHPEERFSVEQEIENIIKENLEGEPFYAKIKSVVPKPVETEVKKRFQDLQNNFCKFKFEVIPFNGSDSIWFTGKMQVETVDKDSWYKFQSRNYNLEEIKDYLEDEIKENLKTYTNDVLEYVQGNDRKALSKLLNRWGQECIKDQFGLIISIKSVGRESTTSENMQTDYRKQIRQGKIIHNATKSLLPFEVKKHTAEFESDVIQKINEAKKSELDELLKQRSILKKRQGNEEEIRDIDSKIYQLTSETEEKASSALEDMELEEKFSGLIEPENSQLTPTSFSEVLENENKNKLLLEGEHSIHSQEQEEDISQPKIIYPLEDN